jgi:hypothetical protein
MRIGHCALSSLLGPRRTFVDQRLGGDPELAAPATLTTGSSTGGAGARPAPPRGRQADPRPIGPIGISAPLAA